MIFLTAAKFIEDCSLGRISCILHGISWSASVLRQMFCVYSGCALLPKQLMNRALLVQMEYGGDRPCRRALQSNTQGLMTKNMLAKALYDNKAECSDELAFRKGDILTVLEQNIYGSEGWWRCYLHGRQGLAPANRLQMFTITQNDVLPAHTHYGSLGRQQSQQNIYQVPSAPRSAAQSTMYEEMDSVYITPLSPNSASKDIYQTPVSSPALILYEKASSSSNQHLFTLPRASRALSSTSQQDLYDVPPSKHCSSVLTQSCAAPSPGRGRSPLLPSAEQTQQQIYAVPSSPDTPERCNLSDTRVANVYDVPPTGIVHCQTDTGEASPGEDRYSTLPNPRKSEWLYDIPVSPEKKDVNSPCRRVSTDKQLVYDVPPVRYRSGMAQTKAEGRGDISQIYDVPPMQKQSSMADQTLYDVPPSRDISSVQQNGKFHKCSSSFVKPKGDDSNENVYDIPRGSAAVLSETGSPIFDDRIYAVPPPLPRNKTPLPASVERDRLSVSSSESRTSTLSTSSSASSDSFTLSSPEDSVKEVTLELDSAIKKITQLQQRLSSSVASLMIFVSSKWRLQEHMEVNLEEIHRAVDSIISSLGVFIDFAQGIKANASHLTDNNIQMRINQQLQILADSFQILSRNQEAINHCKWSLPALVINKPHTTPDDLDRFVMVARTIPDDIKRFVSIIIANGRLLFRKQEEAKKPQIPKEHNMVRKLQMPARHEISMLRESSLVNQAKERRSQLSRQKAIEDSDYVHLQKKEEFEKMQILSSNQKLAKKTECVEKRRGWMKPDAKPFASEEQAKKIEVSLTKESAPSLKQDILHKVDSPKKIFLSDHCYLYFGALQKAINVFNSSLTTDQPPEVFITQGKLIIMVGQKLVDHLCQDVQGTDARTDILHQSSELCSLLKNLALATKTAAIQYPNPAAIHELQNRATELSNHTQLFRGMVQ
ncbi:cas scaffolding protein family member 4 isoform X2 [Ascaphus truei]|uniref:cas scaffolding protein family member 4 isoform X2 n=1 Tax=Ascaphus truei TaxID=8439 RepID=UPI003F5A0684